MKELTIEEKAKRYDEALKKAKNYHSPETECNIRIAMENLFPQLAGSEGERIRKWLTELVEEVRKANPTNVEHNGMCSDAIAWLEKHGEQKPQRMVSAEAKEAMYNKPAWSEEDEDILNTIINHFKVDIECTDEDDMVRWLKSLKERYTWKPSDEQIDALEDAIADAVSSIQKNTLNSLYSDLKKL